MTGGRVMTHSGNSSGRRVRRGALALVLAITAVTALGVQNAQADAGNPILGTIEGSIVVDADGIGATVYVRGEWNWLSHNSDCNFDRAGTGVGIIWNDPHSPGYPVSKDGFTAKVGVASTDDPLNTVDQMVHPVDRGNQAEGYDAGTWRSTAQGYSSNADGEFPSGQQFVDPVDPTPSPSNYAQWKGGCGREPLTATASKVTDGKPCATDSTTCANHPWGSWGYEKNDGKGKGYSHHFKDINDITSVCANFYDVHGGGKFNSGKFQLVNGAKEITVNGNGDNSIQTNSFNTAEGRNCVTPVVVGPSITTSASGPVTIGSAIHDTATISGLAEGETGSITFRAYAPNADGSAATACTTPTYTSPTPIPVNGDGTYTSDDFTPSGAAPQTAGTYVWVATYTSNDAGQPPVTTKCDDAAERSVVNKASSAVNTAQTIVIADYVKVTGSSGTPGGSVTFKLYDAEGCTGNVLQQGSLTLVNGIANTADFTLKANGTYSWLLSYGGDSKYGALTSCAESTTIAGNSPNIAP